MMIIEEKQEEILQLFENLRDDFDRFDRLMVLGAGLSPMKEENKNHSTLYPGCLSRVWVRTSVNDGGKVQIEADSDALVVRGLLAIIVELFQGRSKEEAVSARITVFDRLHMDSVLTDKRRHGMKGLVEEIQKSLRDTEEGMSAEN